jgi:predicted secreted protein
MSNPNILNTTGISGSSNSYYLTVNNTTLLSGAVNTVYKINNITVSNLDGTSNFNFTINHVNANGANIPLAYQVTVPADASVVVIDKSSSIYITENQGLSASANANNKIGLVLSWEAIQ